MISSCLMKHYQFHLLCQGAAFYKNMTELIGESNASLSALCYTSNVITQFCRTKGCGGAGCPPPPIIFERLKLPQQIIYCWKGNLSESPNHFKYRKVFWFRDFMSNFCEWSKFRPFLEVQKNFELLEHKHIIYHFEASDLEINYRTTKYNLLGVT